MSTSIRFRCPHCTGKLAVAANRADTMCACPKCDKQIVIPSASETTSPLPEPATSLAQSIMAQVESIERENEHLEVKLFEERRLRIDAEEKLQSISDDLDNMRSTRDHLIEAEASAVKASQQLLKERNEGLQTLAAAEEAQQELCRQCRKLEQDRDEALQLARRAETLEDEFKRQTTLLDETRHERTYLQQTLESAQDEIGLLRRRQEPLQAENLRLQQAMQESLNTSSSQGGSEAEELIRLRSENRDLQQRLKQQQEDSLRLGNRIQELEIKEPISGN